MDGRGRYLNNILGWIPQETSTLPITPHDHQASCRVVSKAAYLENVKLV